MLPVGTAYTKSQVRRYYESTSAIPVVVSQLMLLVLSVEVPTMPPLFDLGLDRIEMLINMASRGSIEQVGIAPFEYLDPRHNANTTTSLDELSWLQTEFPERPLDKNRLVDSDIPFVVTFREMMKRFRYATLLESKGMVSTDTLVYVNRVQFMRLSEITLAIQRMLQKQTNGQKTILIIPLVPRTMSILVVHDWKQMGMSHSYPNGT